MRAPTAIALLLSASPLAAQTMGDMPGMGHGKAAHPAKAAPAPPAKTAAPTVAAPVAAPPTIAEPMAMDHGAMETPVPDTASAAMDHAMPGMDHSTMPGMDHGTMPGMDHGAGDTMAMTGAYGPYSMNREASGTSWQPDASTHSGIHIMSGDWMLMGHAMLNLVFDRQSGRRGADRGFASGMVMGMAQRPIGDANTLQLRAMLSPDPLMGPRGYPLLLAAGETADGRTQLTDRQHPHDLFMELSASLSHRFSDDASAFVYFGLPGEPAFGPPAFMHRASIMDSPEAPISHHWLDSTHITFGVVTAGVIVGGVKLEASRFKGREPDQHRYNIETPKFDSTTVRLSWNPTASLSLQGSYAKLKSPEQLSPDEDSERWSASAIYTQRVGKAGSWSTTAAWGRKTGIDHGVREHGLNAWVLESAVKPDDRWTVFVRAEQIDSDELLPAPGQVHGPTFTVGKASLGAIRDFRVVKSVKFGIGALAARSLTPRGLDPAYGGDRTSGMVFLRLKVD